MSVDHFSDNDKHKSHRKRYRPEKSSWVGAWSRRIREHFTFGWSSEQPPRLLWVSVFIFVIHSIYAASSSSVLEWLISLLRRLTRPASS